MFVRYEPPARSRRIAFSFLNRLLTSTSVIRLPVPTTWVPQKRLSQRIDLLPGVRSPNNAIRLRLCGQLRWSAYDRPIGLVVPGPSPPGARAACPSGSGISGAETLPMYCGFSNGLCEAVPRWEQ